MKYTKIILVLSFIYAISALADTTTVNQNTVSPINTNPINAGNPNAVMNQYSAAQLNQTSEKISPIPSNPGTPDDARLKLTIEANIAQDPKLAGSTIMVYTKDRVVTLTGTVATQDQNEEALRIAKSVFGVASVVSKLSVANNSANLPPPK